MPKTSSSKTSLYKLWLKDYPGIFTIHGDAIFCQACSHKVTCTIRSHLVQHVETAKHQKNITLYDKKKQMALGEAFNNANNFSTDLCEALCAANIPFAKISNPVFSSFLQKYTHQLIPDKNTLYRKLDTLYDKTFTSLKLKFSDKYIWISVDETTDSLGRFVANLIVGEMACTQASRPSLVAVKMLEKTDNSTVARFVNDSLTKLEVNLENVLYLVSDAAKYMLKAGKALAVFYPRLIHYTCSCHALHRVCEQIRAEHDLVDSLIANVKKVFVKAPSRVQIFKEKFPNLALPPEPIITRWGTWLAAAIYYAENYTNIKSVIQEFDSDAALSIRKAKEIFSNPQLLSQLAYIKANFEFLPKDIEKLESSQTSITEAFEIIDGVHNKINAAGAAAISTQNKLKAVFANNPGYKKLRDINTILCGGHIDLNMSPNIISSYKYVPLQSCEVERFFSLYKSVLTDQRARYTPENLERYLITASNSK